MNNKKPTLRDIVYRATYEYFNGEDVCKECTKYAFQGTHDEGCHYGKLMELVELLELKDTGQVDLRDALPEVTETLPEVTETPPMPKCKPPEPEDEEELTCDDCVYKLDSDGGSFISCSHINRTGCTLTYNKCVYFGPIKVPTGEHYVDRLTANANDFDSIVADMIKELATIQTCENGHKFVANSHEYVCPWCTINKVREILS